MTKIIAEIGWNHLGDMVLAKEMIFAAKENGADFAKFQTWSVNRLKSGPWDYDGRKEIYEKAELSLDQHLELKTYCDEIGITFFSSVFSLKDVALLAQVENDIVKIPSFESRNIKLIQYASDNFKKLIISTGTSTISEIKNTIFKIKPTFVNKVILLHCVSIYPGHPLSSNLPRINKLKQIVKNVGYSDHIEGIESTKVALGYGLSYVEKHFTVDKSLPGRDNAYSILPHELLELKKYIELSEIMNIDLGPNYRLGEQEARNIMTGRFDG